VASTQLKAPRMSLQVRLNSDLPSHLAERCRVVREAPVAAGHEFVLYWMCSAVRADENPALDAAILLARQLDVPLLVYHALSESYPWASDRHHTFILQGARDVQRQLKDRGIRYIFHLQQQGSGPNVLRDLADQSCLVVTEEMPTGPHSLFLRGLLSRTTRAVVAVDTSCIVPMQLVGRSYDRAFQFRDATKRLRKSRLDAAWPVTAELPRYCEINELPFAPVDLQTARLAELVAGCRIDHSVGPVVDTPGGTTAGLERWATFRQSALKHYAARRNNPLLNGVSRLSAYLHYGMVSPLQIAREASQVSSEGGEKFLDELMIWRELAWCFCFYRPDHEDWTAIPAWAQRTLQEHAADRRPYQYSPEQLARGATHDALWNAAQNSLRIHGELHNNVRMTWGKALLEWTSSPRDALRTLIDLNHRYALDGRDPSSYGGILWCLGQFDRPFAPELPILGTVRPRPTAEHSKRLDVAAWSRKTNTPRCQPIPQVAVIGAGLSGVIAARTLRDHGLPVTVFEKSRGFGGRMATRRIDDVSLDHGVQSFQVHDRRFRRAVASWKAEGLVAEWSGEFAELRPHGQCSPAPRQARLVGVPGMKDLVRSLAEDLSVRTETHVSRIERGADRYTLLDIAGAPLGVFDQVICALPAPQTAALAGSMAPEALQSLKYDTMWTLLLVLPERLSVPWNAAEVFESPVRRISRNQTKPGRNAAFGGEHLVIHSTPDWGNAHCDESATEVQTHLLTALADVLGHELSEPILVQAHRWRYARPAPLQGTSDELITAGANLRRSLLDLERQGLVLCGDGLFDTPTACCGVEAAFLSGVAAAGSVLRGLQCEPVRQRTLW
jgi:photolyase PhrII